MHDTTHTLKGEGLDASEDGTGRGVPIIPVTGGASPMAFDWQSGGDARGLDPKHTAQLQRGQVPAICFGVKDSGADATEELAPTLRSGNHDASHANGGVMPAVLVKMAVRRLTPRECERLQGFPDDWTLIPWRTWQESVRKGASYEGLLKERGMMLRGPSIEACPDGPRYKAIGNSMAVPVMAWIGQRIDAYLSRPISPDSPENPS